ncbi:hypothetical protein BDV26DRAFT_247896 [Aspergillus bertholletiae]|uniref:Uncharacterized protein n=1 Tax=Aspergillus bertholletiae TaxID=1226010 RepID=A0A5N7B4A7_9EURO|nr:hypothetical protein BDV26DRAFT_247896 [Aspergillus bertholletiae]
MTGQSADGGGMIIDVTMRICAAASLSPRLELLPDGDPSWCNDRPKQKIFPINCNFLAPFLFLFSLLFSIWSSSCPMFCCCCCLWTRRQVGMNQNIGVPILGHTCYADPLPGPMEQPRRS